MNEDRPLARCPFCGSSASSDNSDTSPSAWVSCDWCNARGPATRRLDAAEKAWNERAEGAAAPKPVQALIGAPIAATLQIEQPHPGFGKLHINQAGELPLLPPAFRPVFHLINGPEPGVHCHPWWLKFTALRGWYEAEQWVVDWQRGVLLDVVQHYVNEGDERRWLAASHVHRIVRTSPDGCLTLAEYGPTVRTSHFYRREGVRLFARAWHAAPDAWVDLAGADPAMFNP